MDLMDLPLPSRSNAPVETQDAAASTSATPFAKPPTIAVPKSSAQRQREYRQRIAASRTPAQSIATRISDAERKRNYRLRKAAYLALNSGSLESITAFSSPSAGRSNDVQSSTQRQHTNQQRQSLAAEPAQTTVQPGTSSDQIEVPDEPMDLTDLPLPSRSNAPVGTQDAAAATSATTFAEPPTIAAPKSSAQRQREYRQRIAASRTPEQSIATRISATERIRNYRLRKAANLALASSSLESTTASSSRSTGRSNDVQNSTQRQLTNQHRQYLAAEPAQTTVQPGTSSDQIEVQKAQSTWNTKWQSSIMRFTSTFLDNDFGYTCSVCDRLWFKNDLKPITAAQLKVISDWFIKENRQLCREEYELVCNTCKRSLNKKSMPPLAKVNGFSYPDRPPGLPPLDPISERLISPRLPFMQVRRLRHDFSYGIIEQVINVPVDAQEMIKCLPRQLNEDDVINVNIKRNLAHKSVYISGYMSKSTIKAWLDVLQKSPLYRLYEINVDLSRLNPTVPLLDDIQDDPSNRIENISAENTPESEILASREQTMMWNEEDCLNIALGQRAKPLNIVYDRHAEELSFPSIYFGEPRRFNMGVSVSHYMMATSEIRRRDRRGATPQKILYVAMKILRLRMVNGICNTFRNVSVTENVTRSMLEDTEFQKEYVIQNLAFMKTVPNSVQYWASRKRDLFAMIRQLGKPTIFLTISANEIRWMKLLTILLKLSNKYPGKTAKDLNTSQRCTLVSDDPVTCCIYFYKLVGSLMKMLKSKQSYNPFGKYSVKDYFLRIEFQHRGSPHAHILLWLNDDPHETVSENMPRTIELVEKLSSVARGDVPNDSIYANQIHKHTFTCTKRGETTCRFGIPYWPMSTTRVLVPMPQSDRRRQTLQQKAKELRTSLGERRYACMDDFLEANSLTYASYLDIVCSTLRRPTLLFRRNFDELMTNTFNPYLAGEVNSNIVIQFILDEYSCAEYVVEYVNKSARGMSNLRRELTTMMQEHPEQDYTGQLKALSIKLLNAVEMSAQEAAWYLLRQPMSETSRDVVYIPTVWPTERQRCRKRRQKMDREGIDGDSTNVWTKNIIQLYEERPASLEQVYLAEFASWYANANDFVDEEDDVPVDDDEDSEGVPEARTLRAPKEYRRRLTGRIIRYRRYDIDETVNYKREMVLLYVQFRNEMSEIIDQNIFLQLFDDNKDTIMERRSLFETNLNIENVMKELETLMTLKNEDNSILQQEESRTASVQRLLGENGAKNVDDVNQIVPRQGSSIVKKRSNVMSKQQYSELVRTTNPKQREIILQVVHRLHGCGDDISEALQICFTGPAGCGKTYTLKCLMETYNRYTQEHKSMNNAYIACASTGKAAVPLGGTTVHSGIRLTTSRVTKLLSTKNLQAYRNMFVGVKAVFIEEISMLSSAILQKINYRLQQITDTYDKPFGGIHVILCGDSRQLPPNEYSLQADDGNEIKVFCPKCNADISHTAKGIQEDQTKIVIAKVYHYFEQEYEELKKSFAGLDLTPLSKFHQRTALATGVSETKVLEILQEEARRNAEAREGPSQTEGPARKRPRQTDSSSEEESENNEDSDGEQSSTGPYAKETFVIKEEPAEECLESYKQETLVVKEEPEESLESYRQETLVVKEEPAEESLDSYNEESEIYVEEPEVKDEPGVSGANDALADPISIDFKTEPWIEEATSSNDTLGVQRATKSYKGRKTKRSAEAPPSASAPPTPNAPLAPPGGQLLLLHEGDIKMEQIESEEGFS